MIPVSPPGQKRKARDLNPHGLAAARFSKPARQPVSGYPPYRVDPAGVEPALPARQAGVVPLDHRPVRRAVETMGVEPNAGGARGTRAPSVHASPALAGVRPGIEPGLPRLPGRRAAATLPDRRVAEAGLEPAWERLRRPCWEPGSSPLRSQYPRQDSNLRGCLQVREVPWPLGHGGVGQ